MLKIKLNINLNIAYETQETNYPTLKQANNKFLIN